MLLRVLTGISFVLAAGLGWRIFGSPGVTSLFYHFGFLLALLVFVACLIAELRVHIAATTGLERERPDRSGPDDHDRDHDGESAPGAAAPDRTTRRNTAERVRNDSLTHRRAHGRIPG